jgi:phytanoyl-CoA hydroxylase
MKLLNLKRNYKKNGFVVVKQLISKETLLEAKENLKDFSQRYKTKSKRKINYTKDSKINSIHDMERWIWIKKFRQSSELKKIVRVLVGKKAKNFGSEFFGKPARVGLKSPIHQDNYYWCVNNNKGITVWIAFNRAEKKNGGIFYYKGSHKIGLLDHKPSYAPGSSQTVSNLNKLKRLKKIYPKLNSGDCLVHDVMVVHGSKPNKSKFSREGITLRYIPKNSKIDKKKQKYYRKKLWEQVRSRTH